MTELEAELRRLAAASLPEATDGHATAFGQLVAYEHAADLARDHATAERKGGWRTIESAPRDGTRLWLIQMTPGDYERVQTGGRYLSGSWGQDWFTDLGGFNPTHWRPLPEPPVAEGE